MSAKTLDQVSEKTVREHLERMLPNSGVLEAVNKCGIGNYPWEMDYLRLMPSGCVHEYEIKISASDLRAEIKKTKKHNDNTPEEFRCSDVINMDEIVRKMRWNHTQCRYMHPIRTFTLVVPSMDLVKLGLEIMPEWVGIIYIGYFDREKNQIVRKPKVLKYSRNITDKERADFLQSFYYRYWALMRGAGGGGRGHKGIISESCALEDATESK